MTTSEAKFWDRALTAEEIATLAKGGEVPGGQAVAPRHEEISMSDIVKRLRDVEAWCHVSTAKEAADEIERLRAEAETMRADCERELREAYADYRESAEAAEAKLSKAVEALEFFADNHNWRLNRPLDPNGSNFDGTSRARATLKEIGGDHG